MVQASAIMYCFLTHKTLLHIVSLHPGVQCINGFQQCAVPENIHTAPTEGCFFFFGGGGGGEEGGSCL